MTFGVDEITNRLTFALVDYMFTFVFTIQNKQVHWLRRTYQV